jgi:Spy/CpxP family protein refolding chaperone
MKKLAMALLVSAFFAAPAMAQDKDKSHEDWDNKIKTELALTPDQVTKYDELSKEYETKMNEIKNDATLNEDAQKEKKMALKKEKETRMAEFLTPDQQAKFKDLMKKKKKDKDKPKDNS